MADRRTVPATIAEIVALRERVPRQRSALVAVSGIDAAGKGHVAAEIAEGLRARGLRAAPICADGWLNLPRVRFSKSEPAEHFYRHAIRFDDLFAGLVSPLRERRSVRVEVDFVEETASEFRRHTYEFADVDVIVLEGIFLLKRAFRPRYDMSIWVDCCFETALERAIARRQEGLSVEETVAAYRTIYFPAQEIHFERDEPRAAASAIVANDPRFAPRSIAAR